MSVWNLIGGAGSAAGGYLMAEDMQDMGAQAASDMGALGAQLQGDSAFRGYGVQTGIGNTAVSPDGSVNLGTGPDRGMQGQAQGNLGSAAGNYLNAASLANMGMDFNNMQQAGYDSTYGANNSLYGSAANAQNAGMSGLAGQQAGMLGASGQAMNNAMGDRAGREQDIYNRAMAMQQPGLDAQRASQQAREYAQGRGGIRGSQFGGTAEDAATARAQAQARNAASFQAMGQAEQEMQGQAAMANQFGQLGQAAAGLQGNLGMNLGQLGSQEYQNQLARAGQLGGMGNQLASQQQANTGLLSQIAQGQSQLGNQQFANSYQDMVHQLQAAQLGGANADRAQTGQLTGAGYAGQLGTAGIQSQVNANTAASNLYGQMYGAGMNAIGQMGQGNSGGSFWDQIKQGLGL